MWNISAVRRKAAVIATAVLALGALMVAGAGTASAEIAPGSGSLDNVNCPAGSVSRVKACHSYDYKFNLRQGNPSTGPIIGTASVVLTLTEELNPRSRAWSLHWQASFNEFTGAALQNTTATIVSDCRGSCSASGPVVSRPVTGGTVLSGDYAITSPSPDIAFSQQNVLVILSNPAVAGVGITGSETTLGPARCDNAATLGAIAAPGCVFPAFTPTLVLNQDPSKAPAPMHAAFVARAQATLPAHNGQPGSNNPLHREANAATIMANRNRACAGFQPIPSPPGTPPALTDSCDEYPFASTKESSMGISQNAHVPRQDNTNGGVQLAVFNAANHVLDNDKYFVDPNLAPRP